MNPIKSKIKKIVGIALLVIGGWGLWHYLTTSMWTYGPFELMIESEEPLEDIGMMLSYDHGDIHHFTDDIYFHKRIVSTGEWLQFPAGRFYSGGKPSMWVVLIHPKIATGRFESGGLFPGDTKQQWEGGAIRFAPVIPAPWNGQDPTAHFIRMADRYLVHFPHNEYTELAKYVSVLEQQLASVEKEGAYDERELKSMRRNLERFREQVKK